MFFEFISPYELDEDLEGFIWDSIGFVLPAVLIFLRLRHAGYKGWLAFFSPSLPGIFHPLMLGLKFFVGHNTSLIGVLPLFMIPVLAIQCLAFPENFKQSKKLDRPAKWILSLLGLGILSFVIALVSGC